MLRNDSIERVKIFTFCIALFLSHVCCRLYPDKHTYNSDFTSDCDRSYGSVPMCYWTRIHISELNVKWVVRKRHWPQRHGFLNVRLSACALKYVLYCLSYRFHKSSLPVVQTTRVIAVKLNKISDSECQNTEKCKKILEEK